MRRGDRCFTDGWMGRHPATIQSIEKRDSDPFFAGVWDECGRLLLRLIRVPPIGFPGASLGDMPQGCRADQAVGEKSPCDEPCDEHMQRGLF